MRLMTVLLLIAFCSSSTAQVALTSSNLTVAGGVAQSGIYSMLGSAGQTAPPGSSASGVYTLNGGFISWPRFNAVNIQHVLVATANAATPFTVVSSVQGGSQLTTMSLLYRRGGDPAFVSIPMVLSVAEGQATIPGEVVTVRGVEYVITADDPASGTHTRMPGAGYYSVRVMAAAPGIQIPTALPAEKYRLISLPVQADDPAASTLLVGAFGTYDNTKWRFFELLANQQPSEYPAVASMHPGKAFWLITKSGGTFSTGSARSIVTDRPFAVALNPGWTFVGNPFAFTVPLSKLRRKSLGALDVRRYADAWQVESGGLDPFSGYAIANGNSSVDTLFLNPDLSTGPLPKPAEPAGRALATWSVGISAKSGTAFDPDNEVIASTSASKSLDDLDRPETPQIGDFVSLYFSHPEWKAVFSRYCTDARPTPDEGETWGFEVTTNMTREVDLHFSGLESIPATFDVWVVDLDLKASADLRATPEYHFSSRGENSCRRFSLIVGNSDYTRDRLTSTGALPQQYELLQNYPNPFNPMTVIQYGLPSPSHVLLEVFDLLGRKVATLVNENQREGFRTNEFDGTGIASGIYIYRFTAVPLGGGQRFSHVRKMVLTK